MKMAVTYENGEIFRHFGKTEHFKIYEIEDGKVISAEVIGTGGTGHEALADFLAAQGVAAVICGGLGDGAQAALADAGIAVFSGAEGSADAAVDTFLRGELVSKGVNCSHHDHHEDGHNCGGHCGGCGGCHSAPPIQGPNAGKVCKVHYIGTLNDDTEFDSSYKHGEPLEFVCGVGMMIRGFDEAVAKMEAGQTVAIHLTPEEAYGYADPTQIFTVDMALLPGAEELNVGEQVMLYDNMGLPFRAKVTARDDAAITFDANHELAGKELHFEIKLVEVQ